MRVQFAQVKELVDPAKKMVGRNVIFQVEGVKQRRLAYILTSHHRDNSASMMGMNWINSFAILQ